MVLLIVAVIVRIEGIEGTAKPLVGPLTLLSLLVPRWYSMGYTQSRRTCVVSWLTCNAYGLVSCTSSASITQ